MSADPHTAGAGQALAGRPWWQRFPTRLGDETRALTAAGYDVLDINVEPVGRTADSGAEPHQKVGRQQFLPTREELSLSLNACVVGQPVRLVVTFPDTYPWQTPAVAAPDATWTRHREPISGLLCLLPDNDTTGWWTPARTVADLLDEQLGKLVAANSGTLAAAELARLEHHVGTSLATMVAPLCETALLRDGQWQWPEQERCGLATLSISGRPGKPLTALAGAVTAGGAPIGTLDACLTARFATSVPVPWVRLDGLTVEKMFDDPAALRTGADPAARTSDRLWTHAMTALPPQLHPDIVSAALPLTGSASPATEATRSTSKDTRRATPGPDGRQQFCVVVFNDEVQYGKCGTSVMLLERWRPSRRHRWRTQLHASAAAGPHDVFARIPAAAPLRNATVTLIGCGAIGSRVALELAQHGVKQLRLVDGDVVDPATASRQLQHLADAGANKTYALAMLLAELTSYTRFRVFPYEVGRPGTHAELHTWLASSDLLIDCAASWPLTRYLAAQARDHSLPMLTAAATGGAWGGTVTRLLHGDHGCWACLEHWRADHALPTPPARPGDALSPDGCTSPTFTGAGIDALGHVALHTARLAIDTLDGGNGLGGDIHTLALRNAHGEATPANWRTHTLEQHPDCPLHGAPPPGQLTLTLQV